MLTAALGTVLVASLGISLVTDLRSRRIPNLVTFPCFALALALRGMLGGWDGADGLASGLLGSAIAFLPFFLLAWAGGMGMGDVKLVTVVGACIGAERILFVLLCIALVGGLQGLLALLWTGSLGRTLRRMALSLARASGLTTAEAPAGRRVTVPYGVAIALGTAWAMVWRPWLGP
jgi:prepilin peptidase CpaA